MRREAENKKNPLEKLSRSISSEMEPGPTAMRPREILKTFPRPKKSIASRNTIAGQISTQRASSFGLDGTTTRSKGQGFNTEALDLLNH